MKTNEKSTTIVPLPENQSKDTNYLPGYQKIFNEFVKCPQTISQPGITLNAIRDDILRLSEQQTEANENIGLFTVKPANRWVELAKALPIPKMLFGQLWYEGELCILFADPNIGKSILGVQIGNSISKGEPTRGFPMEASKQPVLYFDFELSIKQFEQRYSNEFTKHYLFDNNFKRVEINHDSELPTGIGFEAYLNQSLERAIFETGSKVIIIDNITYLKNGTETAKDALPLMKHLKSLKMKHNLSILALAHTPKRDQSRPISKNDLQGSRMLMIFCDSSFAIGESSVDKRLRYVKQIKVRYGEFAFDTDNVIVCEIAKPFNFVQFEFIGFGREIEHLRIQSDADKERRKQEATELRTQGKSNREIARRLGVSEGAIRKWFK